jgi:hypothetical protein
MSATCASQVGGVVRRSCQVLEQIFELFLSHNRLMSELTLRLVTEANEM